MASGAEMLTLARRHVGERYVFGALAPKDNARWNGPWDCAEFASWLVYQVAGKLYGVRGTVPSTANAYTGFWSSDSLSKGKRVSVSAAAATPGALVLRIPKTGAIGHIVVSDGNGGTVEAHSTKTGVLKSVVAGRRWDTGVLIPGFTYDAGAAPIHVDAPPVIYRYKRGTLMRGSKVREIQRAVKAAEISPGPIDGIFGPLTHAGVVAYQRIEGLLVDGEVGPETAGAMGISLT